MNIAELFIQHYGTMPAEVTPLSAAGSNRRYYRLRHTDGSTVIGVEGTSEQENTAFITMARHFRLRQLNSPRLIAMSDDGMNYLQEDLGDTSLFKALEPCIGHWDSDSAAHGIGLLRKTITLLPHFQISADEGMDYSVCYPVGEMNRRSIVWDLNYFKYCFVKMTPVEFNENDLEDDFERLTDELLLRRRDMRFMYRDFQSRNVMLTDAGPVFIDFQGGRKGPLLYDVVSLLWQARLQLPEELRMSLTGDYLDALKSELPETYTDLLREDLPYWVFFRTLQVLGAYGYRGYHERKQHFLDSIPHALRNIVSQGDMLGRYPAIKQIITSIAAL